MSNIEIEDFLPMYPNITSDTFYEDIYHKKEFYDIRVPAFENINKDKWSLLSQQKIISRFLSSKTPYDQLLLHHDMGSGKSCAAIGSIENVKKEEGYKKTLIIAPGPGLLDNFIQEIILKCTDGYYKPSDYNKIRGESEKMRRLRNIAKKNGYIFLTYGGLAKELQKLKIGKGTNDESNKNIIKYFSNMFIVMDEIHHLRPKDAKKEDITTYEEILNMCKCVKNTKILLMSGTPMRDGPEEIASIMNLISPNIDIPLENDFISQYMYYDDNKQLDIKPNMINNLKEIFKGRVSYLSSMQSDIVKTYIGATNIGNLSYFTIDVDIMSSFQTFTYKSINKIGEKKTFELDSRQICLFCYPNDPIDNPIGLYGKKGFDMHIEKISNKFHKGEKSKVVYTYKIKKTLKDLIYTENHKEMLKKIQIYSSKYSKTIKQILNAKDKCIFIYCDSVQGSGCILFSLLLEFFGYKKATGNEESEGLRYALLTDITTSKLDITKIKNRFNNPDNILGKYIQVIIGSTVVTEGFSLYNVQEEHILTPHWNYTPVSQALARGLRVGSHDALIKNGIMPSMNIYQHVSLTSDSKSTIDLKMYELSEEKDISIKRIDRIIKESSFDCALTYPRNKISAKIDGSRECEYQSCNYKCDGISENELNQIDEFEIDYSTYNLYYSQEIVEKVIYKLEELFKTNFTYHYNDIYNILNVEEFYKDFEIIKSLRTIINNNMPIINKYGFINYLKEDNDIYFLVDNLYDNNTYLSSYYTKYPSIINGKSFTDYLNILIMNNVIILINLINTSDYDNFERYIKRIPIIIQEKYIESVIISIILNKKENIILQNNVMTFFKSNIHHFDNKYISSLGIDLRCLNYKSISNMSWNNCTSDEYDDFNKIKLKSQEVFISGNKSGYYGIDTSDNIDNVQNFKIRDIRDVKDVDKSEDKRLVKSGMKCIAGWKKPTLIPLIRLFKLDYPSDFLLGKNKTYIIEYMQNSIKINKSIGDIDLQKIDISELKRIAYWSSKTQIDLCSGIKNWFSDNNLLKIEN